MSGMNVHVTPAKHTKCVAGRAQGQGLLDAELMPPEQPSARPWWQRLPGRGSQGSLSRGGSQEDLRSGEAQPATQRSAAQQARDRLARYLTQTSQLCMSLDSLDMLLVIE